MADDEIKDDKKDGKKPAKAAPAKSGKVMVEITARAAHDGLGGKFFQGAVVEVDSAIAEAWIGAGQAKLK